MTRNNHIIYTEGTTFVSNFKLTGNVLIAVFGRAKGILNFALSKIGRNSEKLRIPFLIRNIIGVSTWRVQKGSFFLPQVLQIVVHRQSE
jgi:hypothetical protein